MKIGIIGNGFVGKATQLLCKCNKIFVYDIDPTKCIPENLLLVDLVVCDLIFICVPTPMNKDKSCHVNIVVDIVNRLKKIVDKNKIIIRSTVEPLTTKKLQVSFMPEFLTEKNWKNDVVDCNLWILGSDYDYTKTKFRNLINESFLANNINYSNYSCVEPTEAELIKYTRNCFLATKVSFFNEIDSICNNLDVDYNVVKKHVVVDKRIGSSHTNVPGFDGKYGFGGTCLPKDINALNTFMKRRNITSYILNSVCQRNDNYDRTEKDWMDDKRASL